MPDTREPSFRLGDSNEPITWEEFLSMPEAAQEIYVGFGMNDAWDKSLTREYLFEGCFVHYPAYITHEQYIEGFQFLIANGYITETGNNMYVADERCRYLVTDILPYEQAKTGAIPGF